MASKKSKLYSVDGKRYAFGFDDSGKINSISQASTGTVSYTHLTLPTNREV